MMSLPVLPMTKQEVTLTEVDTPSCVSKTSRQELIFTVIRGLNCVCVCVCSVRDGYKVGSDVSVSLEFRSSQSEGVFLGISSAKVDAIGLEMINGQVSRELRE